MLLHRGLLRTRGGRLPSEQWQVAPQSIISRRMPSRVQRPMEPSGEPMEGTGGDCFIGSACAAREPSGGSEDSTLRRDESRHGRGGSRDERFSSRGDTVSGGGGRKGADESVESVVASARDSLRGCVSALQLVI